jgi:thioredoxin-like negative regulator of GroEL
MYCIAWWRMANEKQTDTWSILESVLNSDPENEKYKYTAGVYSLYQGNAERAFALLETLQSTDEDAKMLIEKYISVP